MRTITTKRILCVVAVFHAFSVFGRNNIYPSGAQATAMSKAVSGLYHPWAIVSNAAGLSRIKKISLSIDYENRFLVPELSMCSATCTLPTRLGNFSALYSRFGPNYCREDQLLLAFSRTLARRTDVGITFGYYGQRYPESGKTGSTIGFNLGALFEINPNTHLGISVSNPLSTPTLVSGRKEYLAWLIRAGGSSFLSKNLLLGYELEVGQNQQIVIRTGFDWEAATSFHLRLGFDSRPRLSSGIGFQYQILTLDLAFAYHLYLGYSPTFSLRIELP